MCLYKIIPFNGSIFDILNTNCVSALSEKRNLGRVYCLQL